MQQDGKLLVQALLEVGSDTLIFLFFIISSPTHLPESLAPPFFTGHWGRSLPEPDGALRGGAVQPQQELLHAPGGVAEGGAAASRLPVVSDHRRTEGKLFQSDSQVSLWFFLFSSNASCRHFL